MRRNAVWDKKGDGSERDKERGEKEGMMIERIRIGGDLLLGEEIWRLGLVYMQGTRIESGKS